jgi:hypothetical protein
MGSINFTHDPETKTTYCVSIDNDGRHYTGKAKCHEQDADFYTDLTGEIIAAKRAVEKVYKAELKELKRELRIYDNLLNTFRCGIKYDDERDSNMYRQIMRQRRLKQDEIYAVLRLIKTNEDDLSEYLRDKEYFYQEMRKMRARQAQ